MRWRQLLRRKYALNHDYKNNNGRNFQFTKFLFIYFVLNNSRSLSDKRQKSAGVQSSSCRFSFSAERNANTKATEYATFGFSFGILVFFPFWTSLNRWYGFFSVSAAIIRESSDKQLLFRESWRLCRSFINLTEWRQRRMTCKQLIGFINTPN